jgi:drug/metabolite transporter (DMT)-like permease
MTTLPRTADYRSRLAEGTSALLQLALGAALISFSPVLVNVAHVGPTVSGFYRLLFGGLALALIVLLRGDRLWAGRRHLAVAVIAGAVLAVDLAVWHRSILLIGPGLATILGNFQVFFLAAYGVLVLHEHPSVRLKTAVPLAVLGLFLIFGLEWSGLQPGYRLGLLLGVLTGLFYASYILSLRWAQSAPGAPGAMVTVALLCLAGSVFAAGAVQLEGESFRIPDAWTWGVLIAYGLIPQVAGWVLISRALPQVEASRAGLVLLLQPALAFVWDLLLFRRPTTAVELLGAALTVCAIYLGATGRRPVSNTPPPDRSAHS